MPAGTLFCFGFGFTAQTLARALRGRGWRVAGTTRHADKVTEIEKAGAEPVIFTGDAPMAVEGRALLKGASHILLSIPPSEDGDLVLRHHGTDIARMAGLRWLGYLSTTGIYGDHGGAWVDEETPPNPTTERGERRLAAERGWRGLADAHDLPLHIFRLAGIYGPGRNALESLKAGKAKRIVKEGQVFSRIHVDDIVNVLLASMARPNPGRVYNVCDDEAAPPQDVVAHAAALLGIDPPPEIPFEGADLSPMARSFYRDNKRVRNARIKTELGITLAYPTHREGLKSLVAGMG